VLAVLFEFVGALVRWAGRGLSYNQTGSLPLYVAWAFLGATVFFLVLLLR